jgi:hypothetical protein
LEACAVAAEDTEAPDPFELGGTAAVVFLFPFWVTLGAVDFIVVHRMGLTVMR